MSFRSPAMLVLLVAVPLVVWAYVARRRRGAARAHALAAEALVVMGPVPRRRHVPFAVFTVALAVLVVALARPTATVRTPRREGTVVVAIDVSNSMAATDVKPSRIEAAKSAARAFVQRQAAAVKVGLVAFGASALTVQRPTTSHTEVVAAINRLSLGGGTSLGQGLINALSAIAGKPVTLDQDALDSDSAKVDIGYFGDATIVLLSDGENLSRPDPMSAAQLASVAGVHVHTIGVGTPEGTTVQIDGFDQATALDADLLGRIASVTDGSYHTAGDAAGLAAISRTVNVHVKLVSEHTDVSGLFAGIALLLLLTGALLSLMWFGRVL